MARYYNAPKNDIVDLTPKVPIEFYSKIMEQAQQNLNQANATGAAFMTDLYGIEHIDEAARNKAIAMGQEPIAQALDRDFVTPATIASAVSKASQLVNPWRNLNTKQVKEAKREQELRDKWGSNYIGNSVLSQKLYNPETGSWIKPEDIQLIAGNREDLVQALARDNAGRADLKREIEGNWRTILGGKAFEKKNTRVTGLTEAERVAEFVDNQNMAKQYLAQMPEFAKAIAASGIDPVDYMTKEINQWSKQLVKGEDYDSKYLDNPDYGKTRGNVSYTGAPLKATTYDRGIDKMEGKKSDIQSAREYLNPNLVKKRWGEDGALMSNSAVSGVNWVGDKVAQLFTGDKNAKLNPLHTLFTDEDFVTSERKGAEVLKDKKDKYRSLYKTIDKSGDFLKYMPDKNFDQAKLSNQEYRNAVSKARDLAFLDAVEKIEATQYSPLTSYDLKDADFDKGMDRAIEVGMKNSTVVRTDNGEEVELPSLYAKEKSRKILPRNDGNLDIIVDGVVHTLDVFDNNGKGTGVVDQRSQNVLKVQKQLYDALWETEDDKIFNTAINYGNTPVPVPGYNGTGIPVYTVERSNQPGQPNNIMVTYYDPETGTPHEDANGMPLTYPATLAEIAQNTAEILKYLNPNPAKTN